ncbi:MAG: tetratricopeptide repeat protein, partial [Cyanobacteria bacterium P01_A01_bin.80]
MTSEPIDWDEDLPADPEEEINAFLRTLERTDGFRILFICCTPVGGQELIARVQEDLPRKKVEILRFDEPIHNLYQIVQDLPNRDEINVLFIQGLENSLYEYEQTTFGEESEKFAYSWKGVPKILNHLNLNRERFRDSFNICFVFLLRSFSLKYFIHRAPDFFDWRSSIFEFPTKPELLEQESSRVIEEGNSQKYRSLSPEEKIKKILEIEELLKEKHQTEDKKAKLLREQGKVLDAAEEYESALRVFEKAIEIKPDYHKVWNNRGLALRHLGRLEEAIASYNKAIEIKPDYYRAWGNKGYALYQLGRLEEAIKSYDKAIEIKPDDDNAWFNRGIALLQLGRLEEAIKSYDKAIEIKPDHEFAWNNRSYALLQL